MNGMIGRSLKFLAALLRPCEAWLARQERVCRLLNAPLGDYEGVNDIETSSVEVEEVEVELLQ